MPNEPNPFADEIHIEQLEVSARVGVTEDERANPQRLIVNISFCPYQQACDLADKIDQTVNYSAVAEETKSFVCNRSVSLIETLADQLATHLLKTFPIQKRSEEHTSELQSPYDLVCCLLLEKNNICI